MRISRIYNNNVVEATGIGRTVILQGKGLGFGKKTGDFISERAATRVYELTDKKHYLMIKDILNEIPEEYWSFCMDVQRYTEEKLQRQLNTSFYLSLLDHVYIAVQRARKNINLSSNLGTEIKLFYPEIYSTAQGIVSMMEETFKVHFDNGEVYFIATHLLDSTLNLNYSELAKKANELTGFIEQCVSEEYGAMIDTESISYTRFQMHIKRFASAVLADRQDRQNNKINSLYVPLKADYPEQNRTVEKIIREINSRYGCEVGLDEVFYLLLHVIRITEG